jgi:hypothetical protein
MPEHIKYEDDDLFNPETHHESSDVPIGTLLWFIAVFVVFSLVTYFVVLLFYKGLVKVENNRVDPPGTAVARPANADVPQNQPLLQPFPKLNQDGTPVPPQADTPVVDLQDMRATEHERLTTYGWVNRQRGTVHMPIQVAKELMAYRLTVQGQLATAPVVPSGTTGSQPVAPVIPVSTQSPAGTPVPADSGAVNPATTSTTGGTHQ